LGAGFSDGHANAFGATLHQHNFVFELQIHALESDDLQRDESKR
jgi:hypothetical protein